MSDPLPGQMRIDCPTCPYCGKSERITVPRAAYYRWVSGKLLQVAWAEATADERELLLTGTHALCWETYLNEIEEG